MQHVSPPLHDSFKTCGASITLPDDDEPFLEDVGERGRGREGEKGMNVTFS